MQNVVPSAEPTATVGFMEKAKTYLNPDYWMQKLNLDREKVINIALYFGAGFFLGFLIKKYNRYVFAFALFSLALAGFMYLDLVTIAINWSKIYGFIGLKTTSLPADATFWAIMWEWTKLNAVMVFSFLLGFLFGIKVG
jgi:hypothetical protein